MKRTERHHLKENELERLAREARRQIEERGREITGIIIAAVVVAAVALGYFGWRSHVRGKAGEMLAQALAVQEARVAAPGTPNAAGTFPTERARGEAALAKFKAAADAYPSTDAGQFARYQQGATLVTLGRASEATAVYQELANRAGDGIYGQMARLGLAEAQARAGQYNQAIATFKSMADRKDGALPLDGILMQLGRTYLDAGKTGDAQQTFNRLVEEFPNSPYTGDARKQLDGLKKT